MKSWVKTVERFLVSSVVFSVLLACSPSTSVLRTSTKAESGKVNHLKEEGEETSVENELENTNANDAGVITGNGLELSVEVAEELRTELLAADLDPLTAGEVIESSKSYASTQAGQLILITEEQQSLSLTAAEGHENRLISRLDWATKNILEGALLHIAAEEFKEKNDINVRTLITRLAVKSGLKSTESRTKSIKPEKTKGLKIGFIKHGLSTTIEKSFLLAEVTQGTGSVMAGIVDATGSEAGMDEEIEDTSILFESAAQELESLLPTDAPISKVLETSVEEAIKSSEKKSNEFSWGYHLSKRIAKSALKAALSWKDNEAKKSLTKGIYSGTIKALDATESEMDETEGKLAQIGNSLVDVLVESDVDQNLKGDLVEKMNEGMAEALETSEKDLDQISRLSEQGLGVLVGRMSKIGIPIEKLPELASKIMKKVVKSANKISKKRQADTSGKKKLIGKIMSGAFEKLGSSLSANDSEEMTNVVADVAGQMSKAALDSFEEMEVEEEELSEISSVIGENAIPAIARASEKVSKKLKKRLARKIIKGAAAAITKLKKQGKIKKAKSNSAFANISKMAITRISTTAGAQELQEMAVEIAAGFVEGSTEEEDSATETMEIREVVNKSIISALSKIIEEEQQDEEDSEIAQVSVTNFEADLNYTTGSAMNNDANEDQSGLSEYEDCQVYMEEDVAGIYTEITDRRNEGKSSYCKKASREASCTLTRNLSSEYTLKFSGYGENLCELTVESISIAEDTDANTNLSETNVVSDENTLSEESLEDVRLSKPQDVELYNSIWWGTGLSYKKVDGAEWYTMKIVNKETNEKEKIYCSDKSWCKLPLDKLQKGVVYKISVKACSSKRTNSRWNGGIEFKRD